MKNFVKLFSLTFILIATFVLVRKNFFSKNQTVQPSSLTLGQSQENDNLLNINWQNNEYSLSYTKVENLQLLKLLANFQEKITALEAMEKYSCKKLVSGGFYLKDNSPSGYFVVGGQILKKWTKNSIFNGILSINDFATPRITREVPQDHLIIALQTGPLFKENAAWIKTPQIADEEARRIIAAITGDNLLYFLAIFKKDQVFSGPYLKDINNLLSTFEEETGIILADAINLDGGTASAFYSEGLRLSELSPVGSFFCLK